MLEDTRRRTFEELHGLTQAAVDWEPGDEESSIGTVLYHIAVIEADWLYAEVLEQREVPEEAAAVFSYGTRDEQGQLVQVKGIPLEQHLERLQVVRRMLMDVFREMDLDDFHRARSLERYDVTPEWVLHHLMQHEAEHRSQIGSLRGRAEKSLGGDQNES